MTTIEGLSFELIEPDPGWIAGSSLRPPALATNHSPYAFKLSGWVIGRHVPVTRVELLHNGEVIQSAEVGLDRPAIGRRFSAIAWAATSGWDMVVDSRACDRTFECEVRAVFANGPTVPLAVVRGQRPPLPQTGPDFLQPLVITALARSGTTWLMRLLAEHPEILVHREYPYEMRPGLYWMHLFRVLSGFADYSRELSRPRHFQRHEFAAGANPFQGPKFAAFPHVRQWTQETYIENLARFCFESVEGWYRSLAIDQGTPNPSYFAEKHHMLQARPIQMWELYPRAREIFLVRDLRDVAVSTLAFNSKHGPRDASNHHVNQGVPLLHVLQHQAADLLAQWQRRAQHSHLVRYEDLLLRPLVTLEGLLGYVGLDASTATIERMVERASLPNDRMTDHVTSSSPATSVGRWRNDLDPSMQTFATELFSDIMVSFGYSGTEQYETADGTRG